MTAYDQLIPDRQARLELGGISEMTAWRWDRDPKMAALGWPPRVRIGKRNYRSRTAIEKFKAAVISGARQ